ncbi:cobyrinic acid a,c-diamide synthase [Peptostreptococcus sp. MV1]|uniref:cobyrinate a,c-diamide synthase n=1 Tax=Peptostreptococcus sp. MV1 TaxID=1219626 RepID=UPI00050EC59E|nr:cobyrinate a,c-diamide synthase [Peptostreptococcus sp. MV1]KGF12741.1 cobyrinic acid a,c-diamide synthase [Peptostreptococcus sp. MV1]
MKKIVIAGTGSGVGKTTISLGIMKALVNRGKSVQPFKVGPDYIDPSYHKYVTGRPSRNLDSYMLDEDQVKYVYSQASKSTDISIIEGVMGLYDGLGIDINKHSTSQIAKTLKAPLILVLDAKAMGASAAAMVLGYKQLDKNVDIVGVIANNVRTKRHYEIVKASIEKYCSLEVLGYLPPDDEISLESRQLGLVPSQEMENLDKKIDRIGQLVEEYVDVDRIIELSESEAVTSSFELSMFVEDPDVLDLARDKRMAVAYDKAFNFYYPSNIELLKSIGVQLKFFSPLEDESVPDADIIYIGGGFPEVFAGQLEANKSMRESLYRAYEANKPIYAECGGLMYLGEDLLDLEGNSFQMVGAIKGHSKMEKSLKRFGYCQATAKEDNLIAYRGQQICGHEFHHSSFHSDLDTAFDIEKIVNGQVIDRWEGGYFSKNTLASYLHIHFYNNLSLVCYLLSRV